ncbi:cellulose binding domain-containing protein, partial [Streptomyces sp. WI03-4A]
TEVRLGAGGPPAAEGAEAKEPAARARVLRNALLGAAVLLSALALGVSMMPFGGSGDAGAAARDDRQPVADPAAPHTTARTPAASPSASAERSASGSPSTTPSRAATKAEAGRKNPGPGPQGTSSATPGGHPSRTRAPAATCRVAYHLDSQWAVGFQATVTVTTDKALTGWQVAWNFRDGQQAGQMWDATVHQDGSRVTATAADYNRAVPAHGSLSFGFIASWQGENRPPHGFTLNGAPCATG